MDPRQRRVWISGGVSSFVGLWTSSHPPFGPARLRACVCVCVCMRVYVLVRVHVYTGGVRVGGGGLAHARVLHNTSDRLNLHLPDRRGHLGVRECVCACVRVTITRTGARTCTHAHAHQ